MSMFEKNNNWPTEPKNSHHSIQDFSLAQDGPGKWNVIHYLSRHPVARVYTVSIFEAYNALKITLITDRLMK